MRRYGIVFRRSEQPHLQDLPLQVTDTHQETHGADARNLKTSSATTSELQKLELEFLGSLLPGIVHNLATPLSGVIGATQLLEMRIAEQERLIHELERVSPTQADALLKQHAKNCSNLDIMSRNARQLTELLQIIIRRFHRGSQETPAPLSLYELISNELQFLDANLTYKHKVRKRFELSTEPFTVFATYKRVTAVIDEFVMQALAAHDFTRGLVDLSVKTEFDSNWGNIALDVRVFETEDEPLETDALRLYLAILGEQGVQYEIEQERGHVHVDLKLPRKPIA